MRYLLFGISIILIAASADLTLTDAQKLAIREIQVKKQSVELRMAELAQQFQELRRQDEQLAAMLAEQVKSATPAGFQLDVSSLLLKATPKAQ